MRVAQRFRPGARVWAAAVLILAAAPAYCQSCALCYTQAASAGTRFIQALRSGILALIIPPMFLSVGITVLAYRKRNQFHQPDSEVGSATDSDPWCNMERQISELPPSGDQWRPSK